MGMRLHSDTLGNVERDFLAEHVHTHGPRLLAYARRMLGNTHDAEDVVADAFCRAADNLDSLRATDRPDLYLLTTVRNLCRDRFRRQKPVVSVGEMMAELPGMHVDGPVDADADEQKRRLRTAVDQLPEHLREVVVLRLATDLRFEEISELLHIPLGTALSRMHSAVKWLRQRLECEV